MAWLDGAVNGMVSRLMQAGFTPDEAFCLAQAAYIKERKRAAGVPRAVLERQQVSFEINQTLKRLDPFPTGPEAHRQRIILWEKVFGRGSWHEPIDPDEIYGPEHGGPAETILDSFMANKIAADAAFTKLYHVISAEGDQPSPLDDLRRGFQALAGGNSLACKFQIEGSTDVQSGLIACTKEKVGLFSMQSLTTSGDPLPGDRILNFSSIRNVGYTVVPGAVTIANLAHFTGFELPNLAMRIVFDNDEVWDLGFSVKQMGGYDSTPYVNFVRGLHEDYQNWQAASMPASVPEAGSVDKTVGLASMNTPRVDHTATLLPDGTVLVVGGEDSGIHVVSSSELYNPTTGLWQSIASMDIARGVHTATLLPNEMVLVAGGFTDGWNEVSSAELYDPVRGTWLETASLSIVRAGHSATLLPDGKVLVAGGSSKGGPSVASAELYDPATETWSTTARMVAARSGHTATLLPNGTVLVCGGCADFNTQYSAELFDPATGMWSLAASMPVARDGHAATLLPSGAVLVSGGRGVGRADKGPVAACQVYDPGTGAWSMTASMAVGRSGHNAALMPDGTVLVSGGTTAGTTGQSGSHDGVGSSEVFDPETGVWSLLAGVGGTRRDHTATLLPNGTVLIAGGMDGDSRKSLASVDIYG
ncbi:kelch motif-containing protein [Pseudarthrobacter sp. GA104]|uniref:Kelch repeat-containing protein n=1 Tax=Pseudarthrobacter sp. GA104 TaxID=2676311 RepID=UPI0012F9D8C2|nr:kelch motif-containing protein [Pseudarthrobacter sp. GA104]MUU73533.1 hypothetical protein [Pseudarthrobacter sp. GA104]